MSAADDVAEQLTIHQLLEDKLYAKWLSMPPDVDWVTFSGMPWRVWVRRERGRGWSRRDFKSYKKAYKFLVENLDLFYDAALCSKVKGFQPPVVRDKTTKRKRHHIPAFPGQNDKHVWCPHCRRPTIFAAFSRHHSFPPNMPPAPHERRCAICGISITGIRVYH